MENSDECPGHNTLIETTPLAIPLNDTSEYGDATTSDPQAEPKRDSKSDKVPRKRKIPKFKNASVFLRAVLHLEQVLPYAMLQKKGLRHLSQYHQHHKQTDIDKAVSCFRTAMHLSVGKKLPRPEMQQGLASSLIHRYSLLGDVGDLDEGIICGRQELSLHPVDHSNRSYPLSSLATCLLGRYQNLGNTEDLENAISYSQEAVQLRPIGHPDRSSALNDLASCLWERYQRLGNVKDLEDATSYSQEALLPELVGHSARSTALNNLGLCLEEQFRRRGDFADFERAISSWQEALLLTPAEDPGRSATLNNLGTCLQERYRYQRGLGDLNGAISYHQEALLYRAAGHPDRPTSLNNLGSSLLERYQHQGDHRDLEVAITHHEEALSFHPPGHPDRSFSLNNLAACFHHLYSKIDHIEGMEKAISYIREAARYHPVGHPGRPMILNNLGTCLYLRYQKLKCTADLEEAISYIQEAIDLQPLDHPGLTSLMLSLAITYLFYSPLPGQHWRAKEASKLLEEAAHRSTSATLTQFQASQLWIQTLDRTSRLPAYQKSLELADRYILTQPSITSRYQLLSFLSPSSTSDAAAEAISEGRFAMAVEFLEQGRTLLWSQLGRYRSPLDALREVDSRLATEFEELSRQLETTAISNYPGKVTRISLEDEARKYRRAREDWDAAVIRIRELPGFGTFLQATPFMVLKQAAVGGPVIVLNISTYRSDAIIVQHAGDPLVVPLHDVRPEDINKHASEFYRAVSITECGTKKKIMLQTLRFLWEDVVKPVVQKLQDVGIGHGSRIWWYPTSKLTMLPLHAAGPHRGNEPNLPDLYVSSYTPTLSALLRSGASSGSEDFTSRSSTTPHLLLISQPNVPGQREIECVREERHVIQSVVPLVDALLDQDGTYDAVIEGLQTHRWIHFASHGSQNLLEPFLSRFHLYERDLTLLDIIEARLPRGEFAFLSSCHSAAGTESTPDEIIHLAAGLQFSGFRSVIGTLWHMADVDGPVVAEEVYKHIFRQDETDSGCRVSVDFRDAARALNIATKVLREKGVPIDRWINFVHIGA